MISCCSTLYLPNSETQLVLSSGSHRARQVLLRDDRLVLREKINRLVDTKTPRSAKLVQFFFNRNGEPLPRYASDDNLASKGIKQHHIACSASFVWFSARAVAPTRKRPTSWQ